MLKSGLKMCCVPSVWPPRLWGVYVGTETSSVLFHSRSHLGQGPQWWTLSSLQALFSMSLSLFFLLPSVPSACPHFCSWKDIFLVFPIGNSLPSTKPCTLDLKGKFFGLGLCCLNLVLKVKVVQSYLTLCDPMDYTVHGILQARILEWVAYPFFSGSSWSRNRTGVSCTAGGFFTSWAKTETI